jgi:hypothetical protein
MELLKLKEYIYARLNECGIQVYSLRVPLNGIYPCIVFSFPSSSMEGNREDKILELNFWDDSSDDSNILIASEYIKSALNYTWQSEIEGFYQCYLDFEGEIPDTESNISRIQQRYLLKVR